MELKSYEYQGEFLKQFEQPERSGICNQFLSVIRAGAADLDAVVEGLRVDVEWRLRDSYLKNEKRAAQELLQSVLELDETYSFIEFLVAREALPHAERESLRNATRSEHKAAYYAVNPPTPKQLQYLRDLGCPEDQLPAKMSDATAAIDEWKAKNKRARSVVAQRETANASF